MAHVITEPCFGCKHTLCLADCPTDAFREGENMLYIDPDSCIDCYVCAPNCPEEAIFQDDDVPDAWSEFIQLNADMSQTCPEITEQKTPLKQ